MSDKLTNTTPIIKSSFIIGTPCGKINLFEK